MSSRKKTALLLFFFAVCVSAALLTDFLQSQIEQVRPVELFQVVYRQVNAVRKDNYSSAYEQVSGTFQRKFSLNQFIGLVRSDFAGISKRARIEFGRVETRGDFAVLRVYFIDPRGNVVPCVYTLVNEGESWKIDSARVLKRWPEGSRFAGLRV